MDRLSVISKVMKGWFYKIEQYRTIPTPGGYFNKEKISTFN